MAYISNEIINEIRNKTDIVEVVSRYVNLTKTGKNYIGVCPFHDDHSPSMSVSPEKQIYTCFSCGASGNVFTFVSDFEKISFSEAVKLLGEKVGINVSNDIKVNTKRDEYFDIYDLASKFYQNSLNSSLGKNAIEYLENRHLDKETIKKFGIGLSIQKVSLTKYLTNKKYSLDKLIDIGLTNDNGNDIFVSRIMFPIWGLSGNVVAFSGRIYNTKDNSKYINTKETDNFKKGKILYNYHIAKEYLKKNDTVIIMEGQMDVIRASTVGINNCIATMGTALTKDHKMVLKNMAKNIILCFDGDAAGEKATLSAIELLEDTGVNIKIVRLPNNMDPDEYILKEGKDSFLYQIKSAMTLIDYKMEILKKDKTPIIVGGTGLYVDSLIYGIEYNEMNVDLEYRKELEKIADEKGLDYLYSLAEKIDKHAAEKISKNDKKRICRILEIYKSTGKTKTELEIESRKKELKYDFKVFAIDMDRAILYDRINRRVDIMVKNGLIEEVKNLIKKYNEIPTAMQGLGYKEVVAYFNNEYSKEEMIEKIKMESRRYAKRQLTWFRRNKSIKWLDASNGTIKNTEIILEEIR